MIADAFDNYNSSQSTAERNQIVQNLVTMGETILRGQVYCHCANGRLELVTTEELGVVIRRHFGCLRNREAVQNLRNREQAIDLTMSSTDDDTASPNNERDAEQPPTLPRNNNVMARLEERVRSQLPGAC